MAGFTPRGFMMVAATQPTFILMEFLMEAYLSELLTVEGTSSLGRVIMENVNTLA